MKIYSLSLEAWNVNSGPWWKIFSLSFWFLVATGKPLLFLGFGILFSSTLLPWPWVLQPLSFPYTFHRLRSPVYIQDGFSLTSFLIPGRFHFPPKATFTFIGPGGHILLGWPQFNPPPLERADFTQHHESKQACFWWAALSVCSESRETSSLLVVHSPPLPSHLSILEAALMTSGLTSCIMQESKQADLEGELILSHLCTFRCFRRGLLMEPRGGKGESRQKLSEVQGAEPLSSSRHMVLVTISCQAQASAAPSLCPFFGQINLVQVLWSSSFPMPKKKTSLAMLCALNALSLAKP